MGLTGAAAVISPGTVSLTGAHGDDRGRRDSSARRCGGQTVASRGRRREHGRIGASAVTVRKRDCERRRLSPPAVPVARCFYRRR